MADLSAFARNTKILDCTLRDGGYYNRWDFEPELVRAYVDAMRGAKVDAVELGFRNPHWNGFVGKLAYSQASQLAGLDLEGVYIGVMSDTKALLAPDGSLDPGRLAQLYGGTDPASFVRLATLPRDLGAASAAARWLHDRGYDVFVNLMQAGGLSRPRLEELARAFRAPVKALYLADSFGSLYPETTAQLVRDLSGIFALPVGFHAHDNLGLANANALAAAHAGATWIDGTVMGMGRGAGNARTENLVPIFHGLGRRDLAPAALGRLVENHFRPLQQKYEWGPSLAFGLAALAEIHPTFAQKLLAGGRYNSTEVLNAIEILRTEPTKATYSDAALLKARAAANGWNQADAEPNLRRLAGRLPPARSAFIAGAGESLRRYEDGIAGAAARCDWVVLTNATPKPFKAGVTLRLIIHRRHARAVAALDDGALIVHPFSDAEAETLFPGRGAQSVPCALGAALQDGGPLQIPSDVVGMYAIELCRRLGVGSVRLAGFDGYGAIGSIDKDPDVMSKEALLTVEMNSYLAQLREAASGMGIASVTPTWYDVPVVSAYEPQ